MECPYCGKKMKLDNNWFICKKCNYYYELIEEDEYDPNDESYAAEDHITSRPWGIDDNGV